MRWSVCVVLLSVFLSGCSKDYEKIELFCREEGSGTREMFAENLGLVSDGIDQIADFASVTNSGAVILSAVSRNKNAIGFLSAAAVSEDVKPVSIDGKNIKDGNEYPLSRDFLIAYDGDRKDEIINDFLSYLSSLNIYGIVEKMGYFSVNNNLQYQAGEDLTGDLTIAGSASVYPLMEQLVSEYKQYQPNVKIEVQQNDSSTGISLLSRGITDLAMSSRKIKEGELDKRFRTISIARDAIAVIVHPSNTKNDFSIEELASVFSGKIRTWNDMV